MSLRPSISWLAAFVPATVVLEHAGAPAPAVFLAAALAIIPVAALITRSTEQLASRTGDAIGGLLNASFGNLPEMIISGVALQRGLFDMVRASLAGVILANLLLALGVAFLLGGVRLHEQRFNPTAARAYGSLMLVSVVSMAVPSAFGRLAAGTGGETRLNLALAVALLGTYALYLLYMLRTHAADFASHAAAEEDGHGARWSVGRAIASLIGASLVAAWMSEILVGAAEPTGRALGMSDTFIGLVFLAIVGGAAESGSAIVMGRRDRMDLAIGILMGSCIQIALFVAPLLVLASRLIAPRPFTLAFGRGEVVCLFLCVLMVTQVTGDGRSTWYRGVQLVAVYAIMAMLFFFIPEASP